MQCLIIFFLSKLNDMIERFVTKMLQYINKWKYVAIIILILVSSILNLGQTSFHVCTMSKEMLMGITLQKFTIQIEFKNSNMSISFTSYKKSRKQRAIQKSSIWQFGFISKKKSKNQIQFSGIGMLGVVKETFDRWSLFTCI